MWKKYRLGLLVALGCVATSCFGESPVATTIGSILSSPTIDVANKLYVARGGSNILRYRRNADGTYSYEASWTIDEATILAMDATHVAGQVWVFYRDQPGWPYLRRYVLRSGTTVPEQTGTVDFPLLREWDSINDIAATPDGRVLVAGVHEDGPRLMACSINGGCYFIEWAHRTGDDRTNLRNPSRVDADMVTGDVYVVDDYRAAGEAQAAARVGRYDSGLEPSGSPLQVLKTGADISVQDGYVLALDGANATNLNLAFYQDYRDERPWYRWSTFRTAERTMGIAGGQRLSAQCAYGVALNRVAGPTAATRIDQHFIGSCN